MVFVHSSSVLVLLGIGFPKKVLGRNTFGGKCASLFFYCFPPSVSFIDSTCPHCDIGGNVRQRIFHGCGRPMMFW